MPRNKDSHSEKNAPPRRDGTRIPIQLLVDYKADGSYLFDFCRDMGRGGVFIETATPQPVNKELELTFTIPDSKETIVTLGKVIWVQEKILDRPDLTAGMGIQFVNFSEAHRELLEKFVRRYNLQKSA